MFAIPKPSSGKQANFTACKRSASLKDAIRGTEDKPKSKTVNMKYFVAPLTSQEKPRYV